MFKKIRQTTAVFKHGARIKAQLVPDDAVMVDQAPGFLQDPLAAAVRGDFEPVVSLLAELRHQRRWAARSQAVEHLARHATISSAWLQDWQQAQPDNPDQLVVRAAHMIQEAWNVRGAAVSSQTAEDQFRAFHSLLEDVTPLLQHVMDHEPEDPEPWALALLQARGLELGGEDVNACLTMLVRADPDHFGGHRAAMMYLTPKWFGNRASMVAFVEDVSAGRPPTSRLHTLPLLAYVEYFFDPTDHDRTEYADHLAAAVERAAAWVDAVGEADPVGVAETRNLLAWAYLAHDDFEAAHAQFVALGTHATSYPWYYLSEDERTTFLELRDAVAIRVAAAL